MRSPWPPHWTKRLAPMAWLGLFIVGGGVVYCGILAASAARAGSGTASLIMCGFMLCCAGFLAALTITFLSARQYADTSATGTTVRVNPLVAWLYGLALAGAILSASLYLPFADKDDVRPLLGSFANSPVTRYLMAALLAISAIGLIALLRTREPGYLRIGPSGVEHANMFRTRSAHWADLVAISDTTGKNVRNPIVFAVWEGKPIVVANADRYGSVGPVLYWMVRHYWQHPDERDELTDGRALDRLRNEQFAAQ